MLGPLDQLAALLAAAVHDYAHPGLSNAFLVASHHECAAPRRAASPPDLRLIGPRARPSSPELTRARSIPPRLASSAPHLPPISPDLGSYAVLYNDQSVLEMYHVSGAWRALQLALSAVHPA